MSGLVHIAVAPEISNSIEYRLLIFASSYWRFPNDSNFPQQFTSANSSPDDTPKLIHCINASHAEADPGPCRAGFSVPAPLPRAILHGVHRQPPIAGAGNYQDIAAIRFWPPASRGICTFLYFQSSFLLGMPLFIRQPTRAFGREPRRGSLWRAPIPFPLCARCKGRLSRRSAGLAWHM